MKGDRRRADPGRRGRPATVASNQARGTNASRPKTKRAAGKKPDKKPNKKPAAKAQKNKVLPPVAIAATASPGRRGAETINQAPPFLVAAVGASAGGLEAFSALIRPIPGDADLALVLVQHLSRNERSQLAELLSRDSALTVLQATHNQKIEPRHVYVIPPDAHMTVRDGHLELKPRMELNSGSSAVDRLFCSVAEQYGERGVAIVLSGGGLDGAAGLREVKLAGGIAFAQSAEQAAVDSMPRAAVATGAVDAVLPVEKIAEELVRLSRHPFFREKDDRRAADELTRDSHLRRVFQLLRRLSGVDFAQYKLPTISRRIERRIALNRLGGLAEYAAFLQQSPTELEALQEDLLIHVTSFFRDPESYKALATSVIPALLAARTDEQPIRAWVPGCSTGEEAYSVAITLLEALGDKVSPNSIQVFGTDVSDATVERARLGAYPQSIVADVPPEILRKYFIRAPGGFRINKSLRERCVFARQDLTRDPPFSRLDLIVCRNLLIYLDQTAQRKVMGVFHYALKATGYLALGRSETVGPHHDLFAVIDKRFKFYSKKRATVRPEVDFRAPDALVGEPTLRAYAPARLPATDGSQADFQAEVNRLLIERYAPAGVLVDGDFRIVRSRGATGAYLELPAGEASLELLKMVRPGLLSGLRSALHEARSRGTTARKEGLRFTADGRDRVLDLEVTPVGPLESRHLLVLFEEASQPPSAPSPGRSTRTGKKAAEGLVKSLEDELATTREHLQAIIHDLAAANEELQSANEEILSSNEELQSTNEELDTAKEELQSTNEELSTLNDELEARNTEMAEINSDLINLLASVQIPIVIVGSDLRIRRFTPAAERTFNLIASDIGRPIGHIKPNVVCPDLEAMITEVIETMTTRDRQVEDHEHRLFALRIRPYKNTESKIDGAVVTLFDITSLREKDDELRSSLATRDALFATVRQPVLLLDQDLRVRSVNRVFLETFGLPPSAEIEGSLVYDLDDNGWNIPALRQVLEEGGGNRFQDQVVEHDFPRIGHRRFLMDGRRFSEGNGRSSVLLVMRDGSESRRQDA